MCETNPVPLSEPYLAGNEWAYIKEALESNWVSSGGPFVDRFERELATSVGAGFAVATVNGTAALHVSLLLCGIGPGDEVVISDLTFIAAANAVRYTGAHPVFVDADWRSWQMNVDKLDHFLARNCESTRGGLRNRYTGRIVRAIMPVHILGSVCDMPAIVELGNRYGLVVIEDATESLGASCQGRAPGTFGRCAGLSFNGNKIITTGGGGMIITNDEDLATRARYLTTQAKDDPLEFVHSEVGYNYRLPNVLAATGCAQLEQLRGFVARKREIARAYTEAMSGLAGVTPMREPPGVFSTYWLYTVHIDEGEAGTGSRDVMRAMATAGIQTRPLWQPMHRSPAQSDAFATDCSVADTLNRECLSLPCSTGLAPREQHRVIDTLSRCI